MSWQSEMDWQESNGYKKESEEIKELIEYIRNTRSDRFCSNNLMRELYDISFVPRDAKPGNRHMIRKLNKIGIATLKGFRLLELKKEIIYER